MYLDYAMEGMFTDPEVTAGSLLDQLRAGLASKNATIADCDELLGKLENETVEFNDTIRQISNAMSEFQAQNITAEELKETVGPLCKNLHDNSTALGMVDCNCEDCDISEAELAALKEFLVGAKQVVAEYRDDLAGAPGDPGDIAAADEAFDEVESLLDGATESTGLLSALIAQEGSGFDDEDDVDFLD